MFQKIIQSYVKTPILHCYFGPIPQEQINSTINYFYIIRKTSLAVGKVTILPCIYFITYIKQILENYDSYEDCAAEMPNFFIFGTLRGTLINSLKTIIEKVRFVFACMYNLVYFRICRYINQPLNTNFENQRQYMRIHRRKLTKLTKWM